MTKSKTASRPAFLCLSGNLGSKLLILSLLVSQGFSSSPSLHASRLYHLLSLCSLLHRQPPSLWSPLHPQLLLCFVPHLCVRKQGYKFPSESGEQADPVHRCRRLLGEHGIQGLSEAQAWRRPHVPLSVKVT